MHHGIFVCAEFYKANFSRVCLNELSYAKGQNVKLSSEKKGLKPQYEKCQKIAKFGFIFRAQRELQVLTPAEGRAQHKNCVYV